MTIYLGPYRHQPAVPRELPVPQRNYLQPGALQLRLVVSRHFFSVFYSKVYQGPAENYHVGSSVIPVQCTVYSVQ